VSEAARNALVNAVLQQKHARNSSSQPSADHLVPHLHQEPHQPADQPPTYRYIHQCTVPDLSISHRPTIPPHNSSDGVLRSTSLRVIVVRAVAVLVGNIGAAILDYELKTVGR
ncbi:hypothetical protein J6590_100159, partial [Homalodisca vitripennis]